MRNGLPAVQRHSKDSESRVTLFSHKLDCDWHLPRELAQVREEWRGRQLVIRRGLAQCSWLRFKSLAGQRRPSSLQVRTLCHCYRLVLITDQKVKSPQWQNLTSTSYTILQSPLHTNNSFVAHMSLKTHDLKNTTTKMTVLLRNSTLWWSK